VSVEARAQGVPVGRHQAGALMRAQGLKAIQPKSFVPKTTDSKHGLGRSANLLDGRKAPERPDEVYVGDITYIPMESGRFLFLASWQDVFTKRVVGWELLPHMRAELVVKALKKAIERRKIPSGLIVHSDGGGQYASHEFKKLLAGNSMQSSMTRKDNHYDNAMAESLFSRFKAELMEKGAFASFEDAYTEIFEYFEIYYNTKRRHSSIGYQTPKRFEENWVEAQKVSKN
jgi:transposase InsO family protein